MGRTPTVLIAYDEFGDPDVETEVLARHQAEIVRLSDLASATARSLGEADALMVTTQVVDRQVLSQLSRCRIVSRVGTGLDAIDLEAAAGLGIWVTNVPDYAVEEVSTHAIALLLAHARQLVGSLEVGRGGRWGSSSLPRIQRLQGQTLGLLGLGRIAQAVAIKAHGLGMQVLAHDPLVNSAVFGRLGVSSAGWTELLQKADYLSLHVPLTSETRRVLDRQALELMKPTAIVINTARGGLIDEVALLEALGEGRLAGAALDVLDQEPPPPDHPLLRHPHALVTPHMAWYSEASRRDVRARAAGEVVRVFDGETPHCPANRPAVVRGTG